MSSEASQSAKSVHDFTVKDARGEDVDLSIYKGKVLLIVNVASKCGLTNSNYTELTQLYEKYKEKELEVEVPVEKISRTEGAARCPSSSPSSLHRGSSPCPVESMLEEKLPGC